MSTRTYTGSDALVFLASQVSRPLFGLSIGLEVRVLGESLSANYPEYKDLELVECCGQYQPFGEEDWEGSGLSPHSHIKFVARGKNGLGPFIFVWPPTAVNLDQPACKGLAVESVTVVEQQPD